MIREGGVSSETQTLNYADQMMFFVAQLCYLTVIAGLMRGGWFGKISLGIFFGWAMFAVALALSLLFGTPIVDIIILIGASASTLDGMLAQGSYQLFVGFLPVGEHDREPTRLTESLWTVTWFLIGLALFVSARDTSERRQLAEMETAQRNLRLRVRASQPSKENS